MIERLEKNDRVEDGSQSSTYLLGISCTSLIGIQGMHFHGD